MVGPETIKEVTESLSFNEQGLIPAIAQSAKSGELLMLAWMNAEAVAETLSSGQVTYFSRSRQKLWRKGESSGHRQELVSFRFDCDKDAILVRVNQTGPACHTNRPNCFYYEVKDDGVAVISEPLL